MNDVGVDRAGEAAALAAGDFPQSATSKALNRIADALFRQAKASERAVALQEEMVTTAKQQAATAAVLERELINARQQ